jgi:hypothetical protein
MSPEEIQAITQLVTDTHGAAAGGALAALSVLIFGLVKVLRLKGVQAILAKISPKLSWSSWPKWAAALFVFGLTFVGALLSALALGAAWLPALIAGVSAAVPAALGAMGVDAAVGAVAPKTDDATVPAQNPT